jgi:hypothetical protein
MRFAAVLVALIVAALGTGCAGAPDERAASPERTLEAKEQVSRLVVDPGYRPTAHGGQAYGTWYDYPRASYVAGSYVAYDACYPKWYASEGAPWWERRKLSCHGCGRSPCCCRRGADLYQR